MKPKSLNDERFRDARNVGEDELTEWRADLLKDWSKSPMAFLTALDPTTERTDGKPNCVWNTTDETDKENSAKPFPNWAYLGAVFDLIDTYPVVGIEKSRQVLMTTAVLAHAFHDAAFHDNRKILVSKATLPEAAALIEAKIRVPWSRMPPWLRERLPVSPRPATLARFPGTGSQVIAVAENAAVRTMRGVTASRVIVDEAAFQKFLDAMLRAAIPMAASIVALTSADGGEVGGQAFIEHFDLNRRERMKPIKIDFQSIQNGHKNPVPPEPAIDWSEL